MQTFKNINDHIALAEFAHRTQEDKAGNPYIDHPKRVLEKVRAQGALPFVQSAAVLHDVTEDTAFTPQMLFSLGVPEPVVRLVELLDRGYSKYVWNCIDKNDNNEVWVTLKEIGVANANDFYYHEIKSDPNALLVKLSDIEDNLTPWRLSYFSEETRSRLIAKYNHALSILNA